ncbi:MAG: flagellar biosynthetic protein FliO [Clostridiales bacterium]|jgi:flagellar biogenesis protein FliO|nr:flagellar biosynthetic protein FliO [Clostridiales bacterium]
MIKILCAAGDWSKSFEMIGQFFYILLILAVVSVLAFLCAKGVASARLASMGRAKNIQVLETCCLNAQSGLHLVRAGGKTLLIGVTKECIAVLAEVDAGEIQRESPNAGGRFDRFEKLLAQFRARAPEKGSNK